MTANRTRKWFGQRGAAVVEFALIAIVFITLAIGFLQFGTILYTFNSAAEATRRGARVAVVNPPHAGVILTEMQYFLPGLESSNVSVGYEPSEAECEYVVVSLQQGRNAYLVRPWFFWVVPQDWVPVPSFATALPRESLGGG